MTTTNDRIIEHINAIGPVTVPALRRWIADQLTDNPDALCNALLDDRLTHYSDDCETWITTESQDPR